MVSSLAHRVHRKVIVNMSCSCPGAELRPQRSGRQAGRNSRVSRQEQSVHYT